MGNLALVDLEGEYLPAIAKDINQEHELAISSARTAIEHAHKAGTLLTEAKAQVKHGEWGNWIANNCPFSERTARAYMQLSKRRPVADLGVRETLKLMAEPKEKAIKNMMSSNSVHWLTPNHIVEKVFQTMGDVDLDPCSDPEGNIAASQWFTEEDNGLSHTWAGRVFMNPPYGNPTTANWCYHMTKQPVDQAMILIRSSTGADYFHTLMDWCDAVCFIQGRLEFNPGDNQKTSKSTFYNVMFYKGNKTKQFREQFQSEGKVFNLKGFTQ